MINQRGLKVIANLTPALLCLRLTSLGIFLLFKASSGFFKNCDHSRLKLLISHVQKDMQREFSLLLSLCQGLSLAVLGKEPKTPYFLAVNILPSVLKSAGWASGCGLSVVLQIRNSRFSKGTPKNISARK